MINKQKEFSDLYNTENTRQGIVLFCENGTNERVKMFHLGNIESFGKY